MLAVTVSTGLLIVTFITLLLSSTPQCLCYFCNSQWVVGRDILFGFCSHCHWLLAETMHPLRLPYAVAYRKRLIVVFSFILRFAAGFSKQFNPTIPWHYHLMWWSQGMGGFHIQVFSFGRNNKNRSHASSFRSYASSHGPGQMGQARTAINAQTVVHSQCSALPPMVEVVYCAALFSMYQ